MPETSTQLSSNFPNLKQSRSASTITLITYNNTLCVRKQSQYNITQEYTLLSTLSHPNIIKVFTQDSPNSYIMEYCSNEDLNPKAPITGVSDLISTFKQMCEAVKYLHNNNISHLDIKLENFVRDSEGTIKLIDFGHANYNTESIKKVYGTDFCNAPERYQGEYCGMKADIFSLGICLTGLLAGFVPVMKNGKCFAVGESYIKDNGRFWAIIENECIKQNKDFEGIDEYAIELVNKMVGIHPANRPDISTILNDKFFIE